MSEHVNDKIARMSGNRHVHAVKETYIEHNPTGYAHAAEHIEEAAKKGERLAGMRH